MKPEHSWKVEEMLTVVRCDGLLPLRDIVKKLPGRSKMSLEGFSKKFNSKVPGAFNGLPYSLVRDFDPDCPHLWTDTLYGEICLWVDIAARAHKFPEEVRSSLLIMAELQTWFHDSNAKEIRGEICKVLTSCQPNKSSTAPLKTAKFKSA